MYAYKYIYIYIHIRIHIKKKGNLKKPAKIHTQCYYKQLINKRRILFVVTYGIPRCELRSSNNIFCSIGCFAFRPSLKLRLFTFLKYEKNIENEYEEYRDYLIRPKTRMLKFYSCIS